MNNVGKHAEVLLFQASLAEGHERMALLLEAKDAFIRAETAEKGCGAWRLACISALENKQELCKGWLERAQACETLPERSVVESDPWLKNVRNQKWFKRFLDQLPS
jgi:hypothetical protein